MPNEGLCWRRGRDANAGVTKLGCGIVTMVRRPTLYIAAILEWADAHHARTGMWPNQNCGLVYGQADEKWANIDQALAKGLRGLRPGSSLARLLAKHRNHRNRKALPHFKASEILKWADAFRRATGEWPTSTCGEIADAPGETWMSVDMALRNGLRGLPGGSSLARLLARRRGVRNNFNVPKLTVRQILEWADEHHKRTGQWPTDTTGRIHGAGDETWGAVASALKSSRRGLRTRSSLAKLLFKHRGVRRHVRKPRLSIRQVLVWADNFRSREGRWPNVKSGGIPESDGETWLVIDHALREGRRGLPKTASLAEFLVEHRNVRNLHSLPPLSTNQILRWADEHRKRHGEWPTKESGAVPGSHGETWGSINNALTKGRRGFEGGSSLAKLLADHRGRRNKGDLPRLSQSRIVVWAKQHIAETGEPPRVTSGAVRDAPEESWRQIDSALRRGYRGLPGGSSLHQLLRKRKLISSAN